VDSEGNPRVSESSNSEKPKDVVLTLHPESFEEKKSKLAPL
jgi:hypothetical protein